MRRRHVLRAGAAALGAGVVGGSSAVAGLASAHPGGDATGTETGTAGGGDGGGNGDDGTDGAYAPLGSVAVEGTREVVVSADGRTAYLALGDGYAAVDLSDPAVPTVLAERRDLLADREDGPLRRLDDVKADGDRLAVVGPANPTREDSPRGLLVVDVSDPEQPAELGFHGTGFPIHNCALDGRHCYLTGNGADGNPLVVVDVEDLTEVSRWSLFDADEAWREVPGGLRTIHDVTVRGDVAALAYWDAGTVLLDVSDPADPTPIGHVDPGDPAGLRDPSPRESVVPPGNHHYSLLAPSGDLLAVGRETWAVEYDGDVIGGPSGVDLYDVSTPDDPAHLSTVAPPPTPAPTFAGTWTTAHNLDLRGDTLYTSWYQGGVKRHDVSDPANPVEETWWADPDEGRFWAAALAVPGEFLVASSMGTRAGAPAGLWTFPDAAGIGGDRSRLTGTAGEGSTPTGTASGPGTVTASPTPTATPTPTRTPSPTATDTPSEAAAPGFGVAGALAALGGGAALASRRARRRRADRDRDGDGEE
ncbi:LVIVD repeat-containing protein [Halobaculum sp. EA56]|uniref:LVIVD repeat-containing protein n=1 Tax=Halobaculum sp. EA56 TaxID=3421648 RepID=UPI003EBCB61B